MRKNAPVPNDMAAMLRVRALRFSQLVQKSDWSGCREMLDKTPELLATVTKHERVNYALAEMTLQEVQVAVTSGVIEGAAHIGTNIDLLCDAATVGRVDVMQWLWSERATFGYELAGLPHALSQACQTGKVEAARWLLDLGVPAGAPAEFYAGATRSDNVPLVDAASHGCVELIELLLERGADPNARDFMGNFPLQMAIAHGKRAVDPLLRAGADVHMRYEDEQADLLGGVLAIAIASHTEEADEAFGYLLSMVDPEDHPDALLQAADEGSYSYVKTMLDLGVDVNWQGRRSNVSALMLACSKQSWSAAELLLERGADPNLASADGRTALVWAANRGDLKMIDRLIAAGATPDCVRGAKSFWQHISKQNPEVKRHIRAKLLAQTMEDAMKGSPEGSEPKPGSGGPGPL